MPVTFHILDDGAIFHYQFVTPWTINDLKKFIDRESALRDAAPYPIHTLADFSQSPALPPGALQARTFPTFAHPKSGLIAMVVANSTVRGIVEGALRLVRNQRVYFFDRPEAGLTFLRAAVEQHRAEWR